MRYLLTYSLLSLSLFAVAQQDPRIPPAKDLVTYQLPKNSIYHKGWIDFNKN